MLAAATVGEVAGDICDVWLGMVASVGIGAGDLCRKCQPIKRATMTAAAMVVQGRMRRGPSSAGVAMGVTMRDGDWCADDEM